jgi:AcrR family transcriptional regulator
VLRRDGVSGLTSRAVTSEAGVAKGVVHRHFVDFDAFLAELMLDRAARLDGPMTALRNAAGTGTVAENLANALMAVFSPLGVAIVALVVTRDGVRARLRDAGAPRFPIMTEASSAITTYLAAEQELGRIARTADAPTLSYTLIRAAHLVFTDRDSGPPDEGALHKVVMSILHGAA